MKHILLTVAFVAGICMIRADETNQTDVSKYTALFSSVDHVKNELEIFTNQQLEKSYDFLLLSSIFDKYDMDRPGFEKLYRKISDKAWEDTQGLIKYRSKRGLPVELNGNADSILKSNAITDFGFKNMNRTNLLNSDEMSSLKLALAYEKILATESHRIHKKISHAHGNEASYDPDVAHYLDEEIIEYQSGVIRKLTGYIHNLDSMAKECNTNDNKAATWDLALHMFDEYLEKVE